MNATDYERTRIGHLERLAETVLRDLFPGRGNGNRVGRKGRPVRSLDTGRIFRSSREASLAFGFEDHAVATAINKGCRCGGQRWEYLK